MTILQEKFDSLKYWHPTIKKQFVRLLVNELINAKYLNSDIELTANKNDFLNSFLPIYFDIVDQKFNSVVKTEILFNEFCKKSVELKNFLTTVFETVFLKLDNLNISWDNEQDIEPIERYILVQDKIPFHNPTTIEFLKREKYEKHSDTEFEKLKQEYTNLVKEKDNEKLLSVGISYCYGNIVLPKTYDIIFDIRDLTRYWEQKTVIKYAFNYRNYFHTDLWRGHHSHCLIEVIGEIPEIFNELPNNDGGQTLHKGIGLCTKFDWQYIKEK
ncbi:hypothetical protein [Flavobacterium sp. HJJ]|uniref:hypothetical protein n=1 Tax=Flavobacterium sp. HJJ TaxID=2783792 RepID=UPI00188B2DC5|nr:hypothetical protein [Flavobacterium sp. HJJ]MBF4473220.1 hypothetical protein [Flavobacterium sp. HJJ]